MALSVKVALLTSLGFIFGMSWLVSQVARPIVELPTPLVVRGPGGGAEAGTAIVSDELSPEREGRQARTLVAGRFVRSSVLDAIERKDNIPRTALVVADASELAVEAAEPELPPLYVPQAPVVALVEETLEEPTIAVGGGVPVFTMSAVSEAIVTDLPPDEAPALAVSQPQQPVETAAEAEPAAPAYRQYTVKPGDSLIKILRREMDCKDERSLKVLLAANPEVAKRRDRILPGEVLNLPDLAAAEKASPPGTDADAVVAAKPTPEAPRFRWYTIRKRDSLAAIARRHLNDAERWREIAELNRLDDAHKILPGTRIKLPLVRTDA